MTGRTFATALGAFVVAGASAAAALAKPTVSFTLPTTANAAAAIPFSYHTNGLHANDRVVVQRQEGTAHAWRTVLELHRAKSGSSKLSGLPLGQYQSRIAILDSHNRVLVAQNRSLGVFGTVSLGTLLIGYPGEYDTPYGQQGAYPTATGTFDYVLGLPEDFNFSSRPDNPSPVLARRNHCRAIHIDFLPGAQDGANTTPPTNYIGTLTVVQAVQDPVNTPAAYEPIGHLDAPLHPGTSWALRLSHTGGDDAPSDLAGFYIDGVADRDSTAPFSV